MKRRTSISNTTTTGCPPAHLTTFTPPVTGSQGRIARAFRKWCEDRRAWDIDSLLADGPGWPGDLAAMHDEQRQIAAELGIRWEVPRRWRN